MKNLVTGGAGFIGSHLVDKLLANNEEVICLDNFITGSIQNIEKYFNNKLFNLIKEDIVNLPSLEVDKIWHLACPASPIQYQKDPIYTAKTIFQGTYNVLELARKNKAKLFFASTSEIYGNPNNNSQSEEYFGNVNPNGIRSCYSEGKRFTESLCLNYEKKFKIKVCIARIFNTYGPRMSPHDGRVISSFITNAITNKPLKIFGHGNQKRTFCYIEDLIDGITNIMNTNYSYPLNIGNPHEEFSINDLASLIIKRTSSKSIIIHTNEIQDDPVRRKPDISKARKILDWHPKITINEGIDRTIKYYKNK